MDLFYIEGQVVACLPMCLLACALARLCACSPVHLLACVRARMACKRLVRTIGVFLTVFDYASTVFAKFGEDPFPDKISMNARLDGVCALAWCVRARIVCARSRCVCALAMCVCARIVCVCTVACVRARVCALACVHRYF